MYEAPPPGEVSGRMDGMLEWLNRKLSQKVEFFRAGWRHALRHHRRASVR
jgi:hypothetical protein